MIMGDLLTSGSVLAAFFAGGVALFAPCCIVFLLPSYLAAAVKNRRWKLLPLTFIFAAGLALVLVPITLGMSLVAGTVARFHTPLYVAGGILMLALAVLALSGRMWSMPRFLHTPDVARADTASMFALGVFSGIASSCCAPVLAGVMTLSALSGSAVGGTVLGFAYVFGMVFPMFVMALLWDKFHLGERRFLQARPVRLRLWKGHALVTNTLNVVVAIAFAVMGVFILFLANTGEMTSGPGFQVAIGRWLGGVFGRIETWVAPIPEPLLGAGLLALVAVFVLAMLRDRHQHTTAAGASTDGGTDSDQSIDPDALSSATSAPDATGHCH